MNLICTHLVNLNAPQALGWFDNIVESNPTPLEFATANPNRSQNELIIEAIGAAAQCHSSAMLDAEDPEANITYDIIVKDGEGNIVLENFTLVLVVYQGRLSIYGYLATDKSDDEGEWLRVFGYSGTESGFHCDIPYVNGIAEGMAYQFWEEFIELVPLDTINVLLYEHNRGIDIKFWEEYHEAMIRQPSDYLRKWVLDLTRTLSINNSTAPNLFTTGGWGAEGMTIDEDSELIIRGLVGQGRVDIELLNMFHHTTLIGRKLLSGFGVKDTPHEEEVHD